MAVYPYVRSGVCLSIHLIFYVGRWHSWLHRSLRDLYTNVFQPNRAPIPRDAIEPIPPVCLLRHHRLELGPVVVRWCDSARLPVRVRKR